MNEGTIAVLLVVAEMGVLAALALVVLAAVLLVRRHRERKAIDQLLTAVAEHHQTHRPTLGGWLRRTFGYDEAAAASQAETLLAAEAGLYRQLATALHDRSPNAIAGLSTAVNTLTDRYREAPLAAGGDEQGGLSQDHGADLTKLADDAAAESAASPPEGTPPQRDGEMAAELVYATGDESDEEVEARKEQASPSTSGAKGGPAQAEAGDTGRAQDAAVQAAAQDGTGEAPADRPEDSKRDPLEDLFDAPEEPGKEPPVGR